jgi:Beta-glucosidase/6-phospho-beta-glucosidase/beta-galactosidase
MKKQIYRCIILIGLLSSCGTSGNKENPTDKFSNQYVLNRTYIGEITPKNSKNIAGSFWGIQAGSNREDILAKASEIGVKWTRLSAAWPDIEKQKGVYDFSATDTAFEAALKNGITPFVYLGRGHPEYTGYAEYDDPQLAAVYGRHLKPPIYSEEHMEAFLRYIRAVIERYKDKIEYWEIWNEPNHHSYWGAVPDGKEYGKLLKRTAELIRSIDPDCKIIGGAMAGIDPVFTDDFLNQGTARLIDIISFHNYGAVPEERIYKAVEFLEVIEKHNPNIVVWQGECGYPSHSSTRDYRGRAPWGLNIQAKWLLRQSFVDTYFCKAKLSNYFILANFGNREDIRERTGLRDIDKVLGYPERGGSRVRTWGVNEKCLLSNPDLKEKPAFFAYQNLCAIWDATYKPCSLDNKIRINSEGAFYGIKWDDAFPSLPLLASYRAENGNLLFAWWLPWNMQEFIAEYADIELFVSGASMKEPVLVDLLEGKIYPIDTYEKLADGMTFKNLPLADFPFIICEKEALGVYRK